MSSMDDEFDDFDTKELRIGRSSTSKNHRTHGGNGSGSSFKSLYTPVSLNPCDDGENEEFLDNSEVIGMERGVKGHSYLNSEDEDESIGRAEAAPLVLKT